MNVLYASDSANKTLVVNCGTSVVEVGQVLLSSDAGVTFAPADINAITIDNDTLVAIALKEKGADAGSINALVRGSIYKSRAVFSSDDDSTDAKRNTAINILRQFSIYLDETYSEE